MRCSTSLASGDAFAVDEVRVTTDRASWLTPEVHGQCRLIFVRRGVFRIRVREWETMAQPTFAFAVTPGDEQTIAHTPGATDVSTSIVLGEPLVSAVVGDPSRLPRQPILVSGEAELAHRVLLARVKAGVDAFDLTERILALFVAAVRSRPVGGPGALARHRVADGAMRRLVDDPVHLTLLELAGELGVSAAYLSRTFQRIYGVTLTRYRNALRVRRVLDRIEQGESNLAGIAAELGFADHAHMTRTVREVVGQPPAAVRELLRAECPGPVAVVERPA